MKKIISVIVAAMLALSVAVTAFAADTTATPDTPDSDLILKIKQDANEVFYNGEAELDDITIYIYGTLSDGSIILHPHYYSGSLDVTFTEAIGDYYYTYGPWETAYIYKDSKFSKIKDAYNNGEIDDNVLKELAECSKKYMQNSFEGRSFTFVPKVTDNGLDYYEENEIILNAYYKFFSNVVDYGNVYNDIFITVFGKLSDGSFVLNVDRHNAGHFAAFEEYTYGDYKYFFNSHEAAYLYKDNNFLAVADLLQSGSLSDEQLKELADCSKEYMKNPRNSKGFSFKNTSEEPQTTPTEPASTTAPTEKPSVNPTASTNPVSSSDSPATADTPTNVNSNGAVQTGQSGFAILALVIMLALAGGAMTVYRNKYQK